MCCTGRCIYGKIQSIAGIISVILSEMIQTLLKKIDNLLFSAEKHI